jgi:hypothetical protein
MRFLVQHGSPAVGARHFQEHMWAGDAGTRYAVKRASVIDARTISWVPCAPSCEARAATAVHAATTGQTRLFAAIHEM